jgi:hypothetical protein
MIVFYDAFLTACQPRAVQLARTLGISVEDITDTILRSGEVARFGPLLDESSQEEIPGVPVRRLRDGTAAANVVRVRRDYSCIVEC